MTVSSTLEKLKDRTTSSSFVQNVLQLLSGSTIGQLIAFLASVALTRIYSPAEFGVLALYLAFVSVLLSVVSLRYEVAIPIPAEDGEAISLMRLSFLLVLIIASIVGFVFLFFGRPITKMLNADSLLHYLWLVPVTLLVSGAGQIIGYWSVRRKAFPGVAQGRVSQSLTQGVSQIGMRIP